MDLSLQTEVASFRMEGNIRVTGIAAHTLSQMLLGISCSGKDLLVPVSLRLMPLAWLGGFGVQKRQL